MSAWESGGSWATQPSPMAWAQAKARSPGRVWVHVAVMCEAWTLASDLGLCASSTADQLCDLGDGNSLIGS